MRRAAVTGIGLILIALGTGCGGDPTSRMTEAERAEYFQDLLVRGVAHAEIDEWPQAIEQFTRALPVADGDPVVAFGLAVAHFKNGDLETAREWLGTIDESAPAELRGRAEYLRAKLALEEGDVEEEAAAYRRAASIDPSEPAYPYALSQVVPRLGGPSAQDEVAALVEQAAALWPANARLGAELAQLLLGRDDDAMRRRGIELVVDLSAGQPEVEALVDRGLEEYEADPGRAPVSLRRALNLLRPGKRFQNDSAALEGRLALLPLDRPVTAALARRSEPASVDLVLEQAPLLPRAALFAGQEILQVVTANDATAETARGSREADLVVLTGEAAWHLGRAAEAPERVGAVDGRAGHLLVGELDGDGWMEVIVFSSRGVSLWGRSAEAGWVERELEPELAAVGGVRDAMLLDFEHDGDLDILAVDDSGKLTLVTHRGEAGLGVPEPSPLDLGEPVELLASVDLDGDADQDLLVGTEQQVLVFTNWRQGEYRLSQELPVRGDLAGLRGVDYDGDGAFDVVGWTSSSVFFLRNAGTAGLVVDEVRGQRTVEALGGSIDTLGVGDLDLDGDLDLVVAHSPDDGRFVLSSLAAAVDGPVVTASVEVEGRAAGVAFVDLDGDHDPDPLMWGKGGLETARTSGGESQGWLGVSLRGLMGKVPLDGRGARLDINFGLDKRSFELHRPEIIVGLGGRTPSLLEVMWPNGISEFLFEPPGNAMHVIEQELRIEGSCPFLYASDGEGKRFITDILGLAPLGMLAAPGTYIPPDPEEYLRLPEWVATDGSVELSITEELREVAYLDQVELVVVDAPAAVEVYNGERWIQGPIEGLDLRLLGPLRAPAAVLDHAGNDVLEVVADLDHEYLTNHRGDRLYQGAVPLHSLEIRIPDELAASGRAALVMTGWLHWGNTSTNLARAQDPVGASVFPYIEVPGVDGGWRVAARDVGLPAGKTKPVVVDLTGIVDQADPRVRITTDFEVYWDRIAVGEVLSVEDTRHSIRYVAPSEGALSYGGFSRWYRPSDNGPYMFDYKDRLPVPWRENASGRRAIAWQEHEGFYTDFGPVTDLVAEIDDRLVVFGAGEELELSFDMTAVPPVPEGWKRTLFLHSEGWEKDGDPNVACGQTVGPLPRRGMGRYPCEGGVTVGIETGADAHPGASRWVDRHRLERRVAAWGFGFDDGAGE